MQDDNSMIEEWRAVVGFEGRYEVSSFGRVRSLRNSHGRRRVPLMKRLHPSGNRYLVTTFSVNNVAIPRYVHRLVLKAFGGPPPAGHECAHLDGSRDNNHISNLKWCTRKENHGHKAAHGTHNRGERNRNSVLTASQVVDIRKRYAAGERQCDLSRAFAISATQTHRIVRRKRWTHLPTKDHD